MGRLAAIALVLVAGCDSLFNLEIVEDPVRGDADGGADDGAPDSALPLKLIAAYDFEERRSMEILDVTGNGHDGTCTVCPTEVLSLAGHGMAAQFTAEMSTLVRFAPLELQAFTIMMWVRIDLSALMCSVSKPYGPANDNSYQLCFTTVSTSTFELSYLTQNNQALRATVPMAVGTWHHVAMTYDGTTKALFYDGALVADALGSVIYDGRPTLVGGDMDDEDTMPVAFMTGVLDDLRFYDRAMSQGEIAAAKDQ